jgi:hypothetical protein
MKPTQDTLESLYRHFVRMAKLSHRAKLAREPFSTFWFTNCEAQRNFLHAARELGSAMGRVRTFPARHRKEEA